MALSTAASYSAASSLRGRSQSDTVTCGGRVSVSFASGALALMVDPAPMVARAPMCTGATSMLPDPMKAPSSIAVGHLLAPS